MFSKIKWLGSELPLTELKIRNCGLKILKLLIFVAHFFDSKSRFFGREFFLEIQKSFRDHFSMWQNSDSQRIDASYLFIMERPTEPWLQKQIDEESEFFNDIYQVSNMKIYNSTSEGFNPG